MDWSSTRPRSDLAGVLVEVPNEVWVGVVALLGALVSWIGGQRRGRKLAIEDGDPALFTASFIARADRNFVKMHDDAQFILKHEMRLNAVDANLVRLEKEIEKRAEILTEEIRENRKEVRSEFAALRESMGIERRRDSREGT